MPCQVGLARVRVEVGEERPQVRQIDQDQAALVGEPEEQRQGLLLRLVCTQDLAEQLRPEVGHRRPDRHAGADAAEREELDRVRRRLVRQLQLAHPLRRRPVGGAGLPEPRKVALVVRREHRDARVGKLLCEQLQGARLAGAGRAGDQPVTVHRRERQAHHRLELQVALVHTAAEVDRTAVDRVRLRDRLGEGRHRANPTALLAERARVV